MALSNYAIVHRASRVVRRLTLDADQPLRSDEERIEVLASTSIANGYWRVTPAGAFVRATNAEIDAADVDSVRVAVKRQTRIDAFVTARNAAIDDLALPLKVRNLFAAMKALDGL